MYGIILFLSTRVNLSVKISLHYIAYYLRVYQCGFYYFLFQSKIIYKYMCQGPALAVISILSLFNVSLFVLCLSTWLFLFFLAMCSFRPASWFPVTPPPCLVLVYVIVSTWSSYALLLYIVPLSLMSLLVCYVSFLCLRNFIVSQLVILVVFFFVFFTLLVRLALHLVFLNLLVFLCFCFCSSLVPVFIFALVFSSLQFGFFLYFFYFASLYSCYRFLCLFLSCVLIPPGCCSQDLAVWLDWVYYSSNQALSRPDFGHPPVLQQTALSYCLDSHISPVNPSLVIKCHSLALTQIHC